MTAYDLPGPVDLSNYMLKSELPDPVDLSDYALKSDLPESSDSPPSVVPTVPPELIKGIGSTLLTFYSERNSTDNITLSIGRDEVIKLGDRLGGYKSNIGRYLSVRLEIIGGSPSEKATVSITNANLSKLSAVSYTHLGAH